MKTGEWEDENVFIALALRMYTTASFHSSVKLNWRLESRFPGEILGRALAATAPLTKDSPLLYPPTAAPGMENTPAN